jgi:hypothetical protein
VTGSLGAGGHFISVTYVGDTNFLGSTSPRWIAFYRSDLWRRRNLCLQVSVPIVQSISVPPDSIKLQQAAGYGHPHCGVVGWRVLGNFTTWSLRARGGAFLGRVDCCGGYRIPHRLLPQQSPSCSYGGIASAMCPSISIGVSIMPLSRKLSII